MITLKKENQAGRLQKFDHVAEIIFREMIPKTKDDEAALMEQGHELPASRWCALMQRHLCPPFRISAIPEIVSTYLLTA